MKNPGSDEKGSVSYASRLASEELKSDSGPDELEQ